VDNRCHKSIQVDSYVRLVQGRCIWQVAARRSCRPWKIAIFSTRRNPNWVVNDSSSRTAKQQSRSIPSIVSELLYR
jgi:hypothetical protein